MSRLLSSLSEPLLEPAPTSGGSGVGRLLQPLRLLAGAAGVILLSGAAQLRARLSIPHFSATEGTARAHFVPKEGVEAITVKHNPGVGPLQSLPLVYLDPGASMRCLFLYDHESVEQIAHGAASQEEGWLYGGKLEGFFAHPTGRAEDILKGQLACWPSKAFEAHMKAATAFYEQRAKAENHLKVSESAVWVAGRDHKQIAHWWFQMDPAVPLSKSFLARGGLPLGHLADYHTLYKQSITQPEAFWANIAKSFHWEHPFDPKRILEFNFDRTAGPIFTRWFSGGTTNLCFNALDRHVAAGKGDRVAFIAERNDPNVKAPQPDIWTYKQTLDEVQRLANALKKRGVGKGDVVAIFMPMVPELPMAMLACARIGAIHSVVFGGFSAQALADRLVDGQAKLIITADGVMRGPKRIDLFAIADQAAELAKKNGLTVQHMLVLERLGHKDCPISLRSGRDAWWHEAVSREAASCPVTWMEAEEPLFVLYTSGSTGKPKGVLHTTGGYMVYAATTFKYIFDVQPDKGDVWFCTADCGWITGHSYVTYGPMINGVTQVIFEGVPSHPGVDRFWDIVDRQHVTSLYTAPTAVRALMREGPGPVKKHARSSLRLLGSVGEPINPEAWRWYHEVVGDSNCPIADTWWQTETGGIMITPLPAEGWAQKPGSATLAFFGVQPALLDPETGKEKNPGKPGEGLLAIKFPWPSTIRSVYRNHQRMEETYFSYPGYYFTGDGARRDQDGYYWITGRVDDIVIVSGHNIGSAEVESALVAYPDVAEAAVVGVPHPVKGQALYCYVTLNVGVEPSDKLRSALKSAVRNEVGAFATPDTIHWAPALPKTRSGKIMRRVLRKIAQLGKNIDIKADLGDTSTLADPSVVDTLIATHSQ